jgi:hypothetical protein
VDGDSRRGSHRLSLEALDRGSIDIDGKTFAFVGERVQWPVERRELKFPVPEERYISDRGVVVFGGRTETSACAAKSAERHWRIISERISLSSSGPAICSSKALTRSKARKRTRAYGTGPGHGAVSVSNTEAVMDWTGGRRFGASSASRRLDKPKAANRSASWNARRRTLMRFATSK